MPEALNTFSSVTTSALRRPPDRSTLWSSVTVVANGALSPTWYHVITDARERIPEPLVRPPNSVREGLEYGPTGIFTSTAQLPSRRSLNAFIWRCTHELR
ncbi:hypothetical protein Y032_0527g2965 [Ancylostoma ceylanicum]|uniref:Uncharacterized protein n=1 Tax=Ancylostoma ceylanicum TaxID=53326 RepID=A0A016WRZ3_9BILA|nr:hypothetical protein Y032_0527g2965 [Ancylostoma ceylanicum]